MSGDIPFKDAELKSLTKTMKFSDNTESLELLLMFLKC